MKSLSLHFGVCCAEENDFSRFFNVAKQIGKCGTVPNASMVMLIPSSNFKKLTKKWISEDIETQKI